MTKETELEQLRARRSMIERLMDKQLFHVKLLLQAELQYVEALIFYKERY
jgi:hypothetical protein